jgi:hypothetical protein
MRSGSFVRRCLKAVALSGGLFLFAIAASAQAGITLSGGGYKGIGDPEA